MRRLPRALLCCQTDDSLISLVHVPHLQLPQSLVPKPLNPTHWLALRDTHEQPHTGILAKTPLSPVMGTAECAGTAYTHKPLWLTDPTSAAGHLGPHSLQSLQLLAHQTLKSLQLTVQLQLLAFRAQYAHKNRAQSPLAQQNI